MKRMLKTLLAILVVLPFINVNAATTTTTSAKKDPVNFYIFYGEGCTHCADLHAFTAELETDKEYNHMFNIVDYEVWNDTENQNLMVKAYRYFGETNTDNMGVPLYVIGNYYQSGFPNKTAYPNEYETAVQAIKDAIKSAYESDDYIDVIAGIGTGNIAIDEQEDDSKKKNDISGYIILGITAVVIIAIIFARSRNTYYEDEEEVVEEVKAEPKREIKKETTTKKTTSTKKKKKSSKKRK